MSIVTFINNGKEQTGKTLSVAAISTYMALEHNIKILLISTANENSTLSNCFFPKQKNIIAPQNQFMGTRPGAADNMQSGMTGLIKVARANKIEPSTIRNYTKVVFRDVLEVLFSGNELNEDISQYYPDIIKQANQFYDIVFVDLDYNINQAVYNNIINDSNLVITNVSQRLLSIDNFALDKRQNQLLASLKNMLLVGRYDKFSKYTSKNITRYLGERTQVLTMPYNTLYFEAAEESRVPDYFISLRNIDKEDRNYFFMQEVKRAAEAIMYRLQELNMRI